ncbi:MAG: hypothetical protein AB1553_02000 [Nitrospirota bacterium]
MEVVQAIKQSFRDDFNGSDIDTNIWDLTLGPGMLCTVSGGKLNIDTGVTGNSETILLSKNAYHFPSLLYALVSLSQRIANQEFYIELIDKDNQNRCGWLLDGTTATNGKYFNQNSGLTTTSAASTIVTTASNTILEIEAFRDDVNFHSRTLNGNRSNSYVLQENVPDPAVQYYIRIRVKNTGTPASSTTFAIDAVSIMDITDLFMEITGGRGGLQQLNLSQLL